MKKMQYAPQAVQNTMKQKVKLRFKIRVKNSIAASSVWCQLIGRDYINFMFLLWQWRAPTCCSGYTLSFAQFWSANRSRRICIYVQLQLKKVTWSCSHQRIKLVSYRPIGWAQMEQLWHLGLMVNGSWVWILWGSLVVSGRASDHNCSCAPKTNQSQHMVRKKPISGFRTWYGDFKWTMMKIDKDRSTNYEVFRWLMCFRWQMYNACTIIC